MDDMIRLSQRFIRVCYERCFLKDRTVPLHRSMMTMLNLALQFSTLFSKFIWEQERQRRKLHVQQQEQQQRSTDVNRVTRSGRRTSFNIFKLQRPGYEREELSSSDSDEFSEDEENDDEGEDRMDQDEDMELGENEGVLQRSKKQKMDSNPLGVNTRLSHISTGGAASSSSLTGVSLAQGAEFRKRAHSGLLPTTGAGSSFSPSTPTSQIFSYREQLEALEQEFDRCRAFLAKSLKVVVNANAARGFGSGKSATASSSFADGQGSGAAEGGSNYLDGLILALST